MLFELNNGIINNKQVIYKFTTKKEQLDKDIKKYKIGKDIIEIKHNDEYNYIKPIINKSKIIY